MDDLTLPIVVFATEGITPSTRIHAQCLASPLRLLHRAVTRIYDEALRPVGLSIAQLNLLVAIEQLGTQASPVRLTRILLLEKSTVSRDLQRMEALGWVRRDTGNGKTHAIELTAAGRKLISDAVPAWEEAQKRLRAQLGPDRAAQVHALADQMAGR